MKFDGVAILRKVAKRLPYRLRRGNAGISEREVVNVLLAYFRFAFFCVLVQLAYGRADFAEIYIFFFFYIPASLNIIPRANLFDNYLNRKTGARH